MDGWMREMKAKVGNVGTRLKMNGIWWAVVACLFAADTVLFVESVEERSISLLTCWAHTHTHTHTHMCGSYECCVSCAQTGNKTKLCCIQVHFLPNHI